MRVIIDTNIVVSAAIRDRDPEKVILFVVDSPEFQWIASEAIVAEYMEVLRRPKFGLPPSILERWESVFKSAITLIDVNVNIDFPRDQKDAMFIACALAGDADYVVSGDKDFSEASRIGRTVYLSVGQFKRLVCDSWQK